MARRPHDSTSKQDDLRAWVRRLRTLFDRERELQEQLMRVRADIDRCFGIDTTSTTKGV